MKFRDHPKLSYRGTRTWPPKWFNTVTVPGKLIDGEVGVLADVSIRQLATCRLFLTVRYENHSYLGDMSFDDRQFCLRVHKFLRRSIGRSTKEIGDTDFTRPEGQARFATHW